MSRDGLGCYTIAKQLNDQKVPAFGPSGRWDQSTIDKMLKNRAVVGDLQPTSYESKAKKAAYEEPPVPNFYPAAIDEELFNATQIARQINGSTGRGRKGQFVTNLFGKMVTCLHCGGPVQFHSNGHRKSMICSTALDAGPCYRFRWSCPDFEAAVFDTILGVEEQEQGINQLLELIRSLPNADKYYARMEIAKELRKSVQFLGMAAAGQDPKPTSSDAMIKRNSPGRYLEIWFSSGKSHRSRTFE